MFILMSSTSGSAQDQHNHHNDGQRFGQKQAIVK
jgi:hypothetical protein